MDLEEYEESGPDPWPDPERGPWQLRARFFPIDGSWQLGALVVEPIDRAHPKALTTSQLRMLVPSKMAAEHRKRMSAALKAIASFSSPLPSEETLQAFLSIGSAGDARGRRTYWAGQKLVDVARVYADACARGEPPAKAVAEHFHISRSNAGKVVHRARRKGLLAPVDRAQGGSR